MISVMRPKASTHGFNRLNFLHPVIGAVERRNHPFDQFRHSVFCCFDQELISTASCKADDAKRGCNGHAGLLHPANYIYRYCKLCCHHGRSQYLMNIPLSMPQE